MEFVAEVSMGDLFTLGGHLLAVVGLFLTSYSIDRSNRQKRAEFLINLYHQYASDSDMSSIYYKIEYSIFEYDESFHGSEEEKKLDKLLGFFENIAKLWDMGVITLDDLEIFAYEYRVVYRCKDVQAYLSFLDKWTSEQFDAQSKKFVAFRKLGSVLENRARQTDAITN